VRRHRAFLPLAGIAAAAALAALLVTLSARGPGPAAPAGPSAPPPAPPPDRPDVAGPVAPPAPEAAADPEPPPASEAALPEGYAAAIGIAKQQRLVWSDPDLLAGLDRAIARLTAGDPEVPAAMVAELERSVGLHAYPWFKIAESFVPPPEGFHAAVREKLRSGDLDAIRTLESALANSKRERPDLLAAVLPDLEGRLTVAEEKERTWLVPAIERAGGEVGPRSSRPSPRPHRAPLDEDTRTRMAALVPLADAKRLDPAMERRFLDAMESENEDLRMLARALVGRNRRLALLALESRDPQFRAAALVRLATAEGLTDEETAAIRRVAGDADERVRALAQRILDRD
jgi:hypothetical protein